MFPEVKVAVKVLPGVAPELTLATNKYFLTPDKPVCPASVKFIVFARAIPAPETALSPPLTTPFPSAS